MKANPLYFKTNLSYYSGHIGKSQAREDILQCDLPIVQNSLWNVTCPYGVLYPGILLFVEGSLTLGHTLYK